MQKYQVKNIYIYIYFYIEFFMLLLLHIPKRQSEHSELRRDTSSLVMISSMKNKSVDEQVSLFTISSFGSLPVFPLSNSILKSLFNVVIMQ